MLDFIKKFRPQEVQQTHTKKTGVVYQSTGLMTHPYTEQQSDRREWKVLQHVLRETADINL
jgi:hypothetical protein